MRKPNILSLTTGDLDGIGYEVSVKALIKKKLSKSQRLIIWRSRSCLKKYSRLLKKNYHIEQFYQIEDALSFLQSPTTVQVVELISDENPAIWVEKSAKLCMEKRIDALITGPLSKQLIFDAGLRDMGHTGILARISKTKDVFMTFLGNKFNVICITGHIPLNSVEKNLNSNKITKALSLALALRLNMPSSQSRLPIGVLGLNPHASENGLIGEFDAKLSRIISLLEDPNSFIGPLVPDVAFLKQNWNKYAVFVCLYHDQGLIPFKLVHGQGSGAHYTLGLPFIRTSVDHGTATDIFNKDMANCNSMIDAISWAEKLINPVLKLS